MQAYWPPTVCLRVGIHQLIMQHCMLQGKEASMMTLEKFMEEFADTKAIWVLDAKNVLRTFMDFQAASSYEANIKQAVCPVVRVAIQHGFIPRYGFGAVHEYAAEYLQLEPAIADTIADASDNQFHQSDLRDRLLTLAGIID